MRKYTNKDLDRYCVSCGKMADEWAKDYAYDKAKKDAIDTGISQALFKNEKNEWVNEDYETAIANGRIIDCVLSKHINATS